MTNAKSEPYPTLTKMGVESPKQVDKYYITSLNLIDVLRIVYDRPRDSFLPSRRTYKFPRVQEKAADGEPKNGAAVLKTHPMLRAVLKELQPVLEAKATKENITLKS